MERELCTDPAEEGREHTSVHLHLEEIQLHWSLRLAVPLVLVKNPGSSAGSLYELG